MDRDIDYAAVAVEKALTEKFGRQHDLTDLTVTAKERTIVLRHGDRSGEGSRDDLQGLIRQAESYDDLWEILALHRKVTAASKLHAR